MKPSIRFEVFKRDQFTCVYCGRRSPEVVLEADHVLAKARGGTDELDNLVTSCSECNQGKSDRALDDRPPMLDPKARAATIAEHEAQIAEYAKWKARQREREDEEIRHLGDVFAKIPGATFVRGDSTRWFWDDASVRTFVRRLGYHGVLEALDVVASRRWTFGSWKDADAENADDAWRYFCGVCWRAIKEPRT